MKKRNLKKNISLFILGVVFGISILPVFAFPYSEAPSSISQYGPINGHSYQNRAYCTNWGDGLGVSGKVLTNTQNSETVPTGYMGVNAKLYTQGGIFHNETGWYYNAQTDWLMYKNTDEYYSNGTYYAKGQSRAYNGNGYKTYDTTVTPYVQYSN
jgi:hypothetical protein